jgi:hypothetical protein
MRGIIAAGFIAALVAGVGLRAQDPHAYFNGLVSSQYHWKSWSLRDPKQLGGATYVTYAPSTDTDPQKQDAAKVRILPFYNTTTLTAPVDATATVLTMADGSTGLFPKGRVFRVGAEVMTTVTTLGNGQVQVTRATYGSVAAPHPAGAQVQHATNSLRSQVRLALSMQDAHSYLLVWDSYWTRSYLGIDFNHKAFQLSSGGSNGDQIWLEPGSSYGPASGPWNPATDVSRLHLRTYNQPNGPPLWSDSTGNQTGPGTITNAGEIRLVNGFVTKHGVWVRWFLRLEQRANDYDPVDLWVADETRDPVRLVQNALVSVRPTGRFPNVVYQWWVEFNTSTDDYQRVDNRELIAYVRNLAVLRDVPLDRLPEYLVRPGASVPPSPSLRPPGKPMVY